MLIISNSENAKNLKWHLLVAIVLLAISILFFHKILSNKMVLDNVHHINNLAFLSYNFKDGIFNHKTFPLWSPYFFSGIPLIAIPEHYIFDMNLIILIIFQDIYLAMNISIIFFFFLAGLGMYFLAYAILESRKAAFLSALIYMFNGFMHSFLISAHINLLESYAMIPFVAIFTLKAIRGKNWILYSILAGLFFSFQVLMGGVIFFFYSAVLFGLLIAFSLVSNPNLKNFGKLALISIVVMLVTFGLSAVKLLPTTEFVSQSSRASAVSYQDYLGYPISLKNSFSVFVSNISYADVSGSIGIVGLILLALGFLSFKKKYFMFSLLLAILGVALATGGPAASFFFKYAPGFSKMRHIERALVLFVFGASVLAGYGASNLFSRLEKKNLGRYINIAFVVILIAIAAELVILQNKPKTTNVIEPGKDIKLLQYMSKDTDYFRVMNLGLREIVGTSGYVYYIQEGIEDAKGGGGIWTKDYVNYLGVAEQLNPSRLWGLINVKYIVSDKQIENPNMEFVGKFNECRTCAVWQAFGPYLYKNREYIEKAYVTDTAILVVGEENAAKDIIYLILNRNPSPGNSVMIQEDSISGYSLNELKRFKAVILARGIDQNSASILKLYYDSGGVILPDIVNGKSSIDENDINNLLKVAKGSHEPANITLFSYNRLAADVSSKRGFLVIGERYAFFPGWKAELNGLNAPILKANNFVSSIYLDKNYENVKFEYKPKSFYNGLFITLSTLALIISYFLFLTYKNWKKSKIKQI